MRILVTADSYPAAYVAAATKTAGITPVATAVAIIFSHFLDMVKTGLFFAFFV